MIMDGNKEIRIGLLKEELCHKIKRIDPNLEMGDVLGDISLTVEPGHLKDVASALKDIGFDMLLAVVCIDEDEFFRVVYPLFSFSYTLKLLLVSKVSRFDPKLASVSKVWPAANWHEREQAELFGVIFVGHPDLRNLLLPPDWEGYPLRKDYKQPESYKGISTARSYWEDLG